MGLRTQTQAHRYACTHMHTRTHLHPRTHAHEPDNHVARNCTPPLPLPHSTSTRNTPVQYPSPSHASMPHPMSSIVMLVQDGNGSCSEGCALGQQTSSEPCCRVLDGRSAFCAPQRRFPGPRRYRYIPQMMERKAMKSPHLCTRWRGAKVFRIAVTRQT